MTARKDVCLVVSDIDNTIADKFDGWGKALSSAVDSLAVLHGRSREEIEQDMLKSAEGKVLYVGRDIRHDVANTPSLHPSDPQQAAFIEKEHEKIFHEWDKVKNKAAKTYDGVFATINKIRASGAKFVLYTDSRATAAIARLARMGITADMIDGLYAQPDDKDTAMPLAGRAKELKDGLGSKLTALPPDTFKPNPSNMQRILNDMGVKNPAATVMVGDNIKSDGGGAIALGMNYAWQKGGTVMSGETLKCYEIFFKNSHYRLTTADHLAQMNDSNRPTEILNDFKDLSKHYHFVQNKSLKEEKNQAPKTPAALACFKKSRAQGR